MAPKSSMITPEIGSYLPVSATTLLILAATGLTIVYLTGLAIYNVYFHPLRHFPGPKAWAATRFTLHYYSVRGELDTKLRLLHNTYGEVVRFQPDALSFITDQAWKDIYGHGHSQPKDHKFYITQPGETLDIITSINDADHTRMRRTLAHAFSDRSLREQEPLLKSYTDLLIEKLKGYAASGVSADLCSWYNYTTFDIIGDLAFGQSFECLQSAAYHYFVNTILTMLEAAPWLRLLREFSAIRSIVKPLIPKHLIQGRNAVREYSSETAKKRMAKGVMEEREDFMSYILKHSGRKTSLSEDEIIANSRTLIIAGSETTATLLTGTTYWLLKTPEAYRKATAEVRSTFATEEEITIQNVTNHLPYMMACLEEGFRMYPPVPTFLPRRIPPGPPVRISGYEVAGNTSVAVHQSAAYWSPLNFYQPGSYIPERWLPDSQDPSSPFANDNRKVLQPFSFGPRNCLGRNLAYAEMRLILARMLWTFDMVLEEASQDWGVGQKTFALWVKPALMVRLKERTRT